MPLTRGIARLVALGHMPNSNTSPFQTLILGKLRCDESDGLSGVDNCERDFRFLCAPVDSRSRSIDPIVS